MAEPLRKRILRVWRNGRALRFGAGYVLARCGISRFLTLQYNGFRLRFWPSHFLLYIWTHGSGYRREDVDLVRSLVRPGDTVVDVGANVGTITIASADAAGPSGLVYSFEPHPQTYRWLLENVRLNGLANVVTLNCAAGDDYSVARISDKFADDQNAIVQDGGIEVPSLPLDEIVGSGPVALLKIDVEGYERFVLRGARNLLRRTRCVLIEVSDEHFQAHGYTTADLITDLEAAGYVCRRMNGERVSVGYKPDQTENLLAS